MQNATPAMEKEAKTKLEAFQAQTGAVVIKGFSHIGRPVMEFTDAGTGQ